MGIDLSRPVALRCENGRYKYVYKCDKGHTTVVGASAFLGSRPQPGVGAISCPKCLGKSNAMRLQSVK